MVRRKLVAFPFKIISEVTPRRGRAVASSLGSLLPKGCKWCTAGPPYSWRRSSGREGSPPNAPQPK